MKAVRFVALLLMVIGSLNWGLIGFFDYNLVAQILGDMSVGARVIYALVGLAGLYGIGMICRCCGSCGGSCGCGSNCGCHRK